MIRKIPTWWENSNLGNRKTARKKTGMVGNIPQWEKKRLPLLGAFSTVAPVVYTAKLGPIGSEYITPARE
jgi:hypothetical protein